MRCALDPPRRLAVVLALVALVALVALPRAATAASASSGDAEVAYALGLAAFHHGDFELAAERFERAVAADPDDGAARYWLGLTRLALGDAAAAREQLEAAFRAARPPAVTAERRAADLERARSLAAGGAAIAPDAPSLATASRFGALPGFDLELRAGLGSDSNPQLLADSARARGDDGRVFDGPDADTVAQLGARLELRPLRSPSWTGAFVAQGDQAIYGDFSVLDFTRLAAGVQLAWGGDPGGFLAGPLGYLRVPPGNRRTALLLQARVEDDALDGDDLVTTTGAALSLFVRQGARGQTRLSATVLDQDFADDGVAFREASGTVSEAELEQSVYLGARNRYLRLAVAAGQRDAGAAFDADLGRVRAELALPFAEAWTLSLRAASERRDYDDVASNPLFPSFLADVAREDTTTRLGAVLSWAVRPRLLLSARAAHIDREADLGATAEDFLDLDYQRTVVALGVRWFFFGGGAR